jgi:hypothetical protein
MVPTRTQINCGIIYSLFILQCHYCITRSLLRHLMPFNRQSSYSSPSVIYIIILLTPSFFTQPPTKTQVLNQNNRFIPLSAAEDMDTNYSLTQASPNADKATDTAKGSFSLVSFGCLFSLSFIDNLSTYNLVLKSELLGSDAVMEDK